MANSTVIDAAKFLEQCLKEKGLRVSRIVLFGSQAQRRATDESDIDIVIIR
jgi:predicted nucleotidyltransferase